MNFLISSVPAQYYLHDYKKKKNKVVAANKKEDNKGKNNIKRHKDFKMIVLNNVICWLSDL